MNRQKISNIPLADFRRFLEYMGCTKKSVSGGHEKWVRDGLLRPIVLQTHIDPVSMIVVNSALRTLGVSRQSFFEYYYSKRAK